MGSSFQRQGAAYRKERLVIFKEDRLGGRVRVTVEEERVPCAIAHCGRKTLMNPYVLDVSQTSRTIMNDSH